jgi:hypothetical protein
MAVARIIKRSRQTGAYSRQPNCECLAVNANHWSKGNVCQTHACNIISTLAVCRLIKSALCHPLFGFCTTIV